MVRATCALLFTALLLAAQQPAAEQPAAPRKAPDVAIQVAENKFMWLSEYSGKTRIVAVFETTCPHCQYTSGILNKLQKEYAAKGVQVLATAIEPMSSLHVEDFKKKFQTQYPVGFNDQKYIMKFLGLPEDDPMFVPQIVFVDKNGMIRVHLTGDNPMMREDTQEKNLRETLEKVLKEAK